MLVLSTSSCNPSLVYGKIINPVFFLAEYSYQCYFWSVSCYQIHATSGPQYLIPSRRLSRMVFSFWHADQQRLRLMGASLIIWVSSYDEHVSNTHSALTCSASGIIEWKNTHLYLYLYNSVLNDTKRKPRKQPCLLIQI